MDPLSLILGALATGAASAIKDTTSKVIKDAYSGLKDLILKKAQSDPKVEAALVEYEKNRDIGEKKLAKLLRNYQVDLDSDIARAAEKLIQVIEINKPNPKVYNIQFDGEVKGVAIGDNANVIMDNYEKPTRKKKQQF